MAATYRNAPLVKAPVWTWEIPLYFFVGGAAGAAAVIAAAARFSGPAFASLARDAAWLALAGALISPLLLISDLGRPARFLNMMRVFKPQSPMSMGVWTLILFSTAAAAAVLPLGALSDAASLVAALSGALLATYTGVLIGATVIPAWSRNVAVLPIHFGASGLASAVAVLELSGHVTPAMNALGIGAAAVETAVGAWFLAGRRTDGAAMHAAEALAGPLPLILRLAFGHLAPARVLIAVVTLAASLLTRVAWIDAGRRSARGQP